MRNDPIENNGHDDVEHEDEETTEQEAQRIAAFQLKCATVRKQTQYEIARLAQKRSNLRTQLGISINTMEKWRMEHEQMIRQEQSQGAANK